MPDSVVHTYNLYSRIPKSFGALWTITHTARTQNKNCCKGHKNIKYMLNLCLQSLTFFPFHLDKMKSLKKDWPCLASKCLLSSKTGHLLQVQRWKH